MEGSKPLNAVRPSTTTRNAGTIVGPTCEQCVTHIVMAHWAALSQQWQSPLIADDDFAAEWSTCIDAAGKAFAIGARTSPRLIRAVSTVRIMR